MLHFYLWSLPHHRPQDKLFHHQHNEIGCVNIILLIVHYKVIDNTSHVQLCKWTTDFSLSYMYVSALCLSLIHKFKVWRMNNDDMQW